MKRAFKLHDIARRSLDHRSRCNKLLAVGCKRCVNGGGPRERICVKICIRLDIYCNIGYILKLSAHIRMGYVRIIYLMQVNTLCYAEG